MPAGRERAPGTAARVGGEPRSELEDRLELQARILDALQDAVVTLDPDLRVRSLNRAAEQLYGWRASEALGQHLDAVLGREFVGGADGRHLIFEAAAAAAAAAAAGCRRVESRQHRRSGAALEIESEATALHDGGGRLTGFILVSRDVTERRQAQEALRRSEERLRAIIETEPECVKVIGCDGRLLEMNPSGLAMLEAGSLAEAQSKPLADYVTENREGFIGLFREVMAGGSGRLEFQVTGLRGTRRVLETSAVPMRGKDGSIEGLLGVTRDITEQDRLRAQLAQAQKLESIGRLAGGVAHDFNNLLVAILANVEFLEEGFQAGAPRPEDLQDIRTAAERARDLTAQLLAVARRQVIAPRPLDLATQLRQAEKLLARILGEDVALEVLLGEGLWPIRADAGQLQQVILNLAGNARDAMPRGGRLTVEASNVDVDARSAAAHPGAAAGPHVMLRFTDTGEGMADEVQAHVFEPFFTTKPVGRGTGLGLATVYGIVTQNRGFIDWQSQPAAGTTFLVYFPRSGEAPPSRPEALPAAHGRGGETVLVVEDEAAVRTVAVRALTGAGYRVLSADGGAAALEVLARATAPIDLLLTDVVMPGMSGPELARALRARHPSLRVLFMSGYAPDAIGLRGGLELGGALLTKPFTPAGLVTRVRQFLDAGREATTR